MRSRDDNAANYRRNTRSRTRRETPIIRCSRSPSLCLDPVTPFWRRHLLKIMVFVIFVLIGVVYVYPDIHQHFNIKASIHIIKKCLAEIANLLPEFTYITNIETNVQKESALVSDRNIIEHLRVIVRQEIEEFNADKTGEPDYALESAGGRVLNTKYTECYNRKGNAVSLFGIPLCPTGNCPNTLIQPGVMPGECWAFKGQEGTVIIQLIAKIHVTGFTVEHVARHTAPHGEMSAAPKEFSVWGLKLPEDEKGFYFGEFRYDIRDTAMQYFPVMHKTLATFDVIKLTVHSNHGHPEFTCIYRIRVHGEPEQS